MTDDQLTTFIRDIEAKAGQPMSQIFFEIGQRAGEAWAEVGKCIDFGALRRMAEEQSAADQTQPGCPYTT
jgi:hypothetical protein